MKKSLSLVFVAMLAAVSLPAFAVLDTTAITDQIALVATAVGVIGAAVVLIFLAIKTYKWLRRSL